MPQPKKRKINFNLDDFEEAESRNEKRREILEAVERDFIVDEFVDYLGIEKMIGFAVIKFGLNFVENVLSVLTLVPEECGPWREEIINSQLNLLTNNHETLTSEQERIVKKISESDKYKCGLLRQERESLYNRVFSQILENYPDQSSQPASGFFAGCIAPPTKVCFFCNSELQKNNKPIRVTCYFASGPLPFLKVELRCRSCKINYGIVKHGNTTEGYEYYRSLSIVEASDVVYIDRLVMSMYTSLRYVVFPLV